MGGIEQRRKGLLGGAGAFCLFGHSVDCRLDRREACPQFLATFDSVMCFEQEVEQRLGAVLQVFGVGRFGKSSGLADGFTKSFFEVGRL